jgi:hypothetical protein
MRLSTLGAVGAALLLSPLPALASGPSTEATIGQPPSNHIGLPSPGGKLADTVRPGPIWRIPLDRRYDETTFLTAHNAYANSEEGWPYAQQAWSLSRQLDAGVRAFMLDLHFGKGLGKKNEIYLCHERCSGTGFERKFSKALDLFADFLERHPDEVVTLLLENKAKASMGSPSPRVYDTIRRSRASRYLLDRREAPHPDTKDDPAPDPSEDPDVVREWPTLREMAEKGNRLVILDDKFLKGNPLTLGKHWAWAFENQYGTTDIQKACKPRTQSVNENWSAERKLYLLNYFPTVSVKPVGLVTNDLTQLRKLIDVCADRKVATKRNPNFLALDHIEFGDGLALVNELNGFGRAETWTTTIEKAYGKLHEGFLFRWDRHAAPMLPFFHSLVSDPEKAPAHFLSGIKKVLLTKPSLNPSWKPPSVPKPGLPGLPKKPDVPWVPGVPKPPKIPKPKLPGL